jgi:predicted dehydrogenase
MNILIIGLGSIGKRHVRAIQSLVFAPKIFALRSSKNPKTIPGVNNIFSLEEELMREINFAIVSNPTCEHKKTLIELIPFGFPLFIEKPLFSSLDLEDQINQIKSKNIKSYVACNLRFLSCITFIKDFLRLNNDKILNEVNVYCGSYLPDWRKGVDYRKTYSANADLGGGVHLDLIHELDYLYWIFGNPSKVRRYFKNRSSLGISSVDYANYLLDYNKFCVSLVLNYYRKDSKRSMELVFEDKTLLVDLLKNSVTCKGEVIFSSTDRIADTYILQMEYFLKTIKENMIPFNTVNEAFEVLKICLDR